MLSFKQAGFWGSGWEGLFLKEQFTVSLFSSFSLERAEKHFAHDIHKPCFFVQDSNSNRTPPKRTKGMAVHPCWGLCTQNVVLKVTRLSSAAGYVAESRRDADTGRQPIRDQDVQLLSSPYTNMPYLCFSLGGGVGVPNKETWLMNIMGKCFSALSKKKLKKRDIEVFL